jgi:hypothetical protein
VSQRARFPSWAEAWLAGGFAGETEHFFFQFPLYWQFHWQLASFDLFPRRKPLKIQCLRLEAEIGIGHFSSPSHFKYT